MRIAYILNQRFPTEKAYGIQVAKMCEAFVLAGAEVILFVPTRPSAFNPDPFQYYGVKGFTIVRVASPDWYWPRYLDRFAFKIKNWVSARRLMKTVRKYMPDIVYTRDESIARYAQVFEAHKMTYKKIPVVAISASLKEALVEQGMDASKILIAHDGVSPEDFAVAPEPTIPRDLPVVGYVGQLRTMGMEKGIDTLLAAVARVPYVRALIVGGTAEDVQLYQKQAEKLGVQSRVIFTGRVEPSRVPSYLSACDVLTMPFPNVEHYARFMSPLKLFEYLAAGKPIIASDLPTIREVIDEKSAVLVAPSDPSSLAGGMEKILSDPSFAKELAERSHALVAQYSWEVRAHRILSFISK